MNFSLDLITVIDGDGFDEPVTGIADTEYLELFENPNLILERLKRDGYYVVVDDFLKIVYKLIVLE